MIATTTPVTARDVSLRVGEGPLGTYALRGVSFEARAGELTAVIGPAGAGKSSLLHVLAGLERPTTGYMTLAGHELAGLDERAATALRRDHVGILLADAPALPTITIRENVALPLLIAARRPEPGAVEALLERVGLAEHVHHRPSELTPAERRRAALARALLGGPSVLLVDEPTADLDDEEAASLLGLLHDVAAQDGVAVVVLTRDERAATVADVVARLHAGRLESAMAHGGASLARAA